MKKLLFILMLCQSASAFSQTNANCSIKQISNDTLTPGDSAWVGIIAIDAYPASLTDICYIYIGTPNLSSTALLFSASYWSLMTGPKYFYNGDSLSMCKFVIPASWQPGTAKYIAKNNSVNIVVIPSVTATSELSAPKTIVRYEMYDIMGRPTLQPTGLYVRMEYYSDNTVETKKCFK